jgi:outer membrane receptor protein involved in Fe transport
MLPKQEFYTIRLNRPDDTQWEVFVNPYTAGIIGDRQRETALFSRVLDLHYALLVGNTGMVIVGIAAFLLVILSITGIVLWSGWQKLISGFKIKWNAHANTANTVSGDLLEPERGEGYEVGVKAELFDSRLFATLAYFDITKQNVAVTDPNNRFFSIPTGEQRSRGVELDVTGEILPGWNIIAAYAYIDAEVTADTNPDIVGNRLFNVPKHSASLWTTYEIQSGDLRGLGFGAGFNYVGEREGDLDNSFEVDSYFLTNAAIFYGRDNWRFALNFKNLFNVNYIEAVENSRSSGNYPGEPFTVIGSVSVQF